MRHRSLMRMLCGPARSSFRASSRFAPRRHLLAACGAGWEQLGTCSRLSIGSASAGTRLARVRWRSPRPGILRVLRKSPLPGHKTSSIVNKPVSAVFTSRNSRHHLYWSRLLCPHSRASRNTARRHAPPPNLRPYTRASRSHEEISVLFPDAGAPEAGPRACTTRRRQTNPGSC